MIGVAVDDRRVLMTSDEQSLSATEHHIMMGMVPDAGVITKVSFQGRSDQRNNVIRFGVVLQGGSDVNDISFAAGESIIPGSTEFVLGQPMVFALTTGGSQGFSIYPMWRPVITGAKWVAFMWTMNLPAVTTITCNVVWERFQRRDSGRIMSPGEAESQDVSA